MNVLKLAAFAQNGQGGNPAGVAFCEAMPSEIEMLRIAKEVGYSETAFLVKQNNSWRVRYFAPELEVPFCGHATIALDAALGKRFGTSEHKLTLSRMVSSIKAARHLEIDSGNQSRHTHGDHFLSNCQPRLEPARTCLESCP